MKRQIIFGVSAVAIMAAGYGLGASTWPDVSRKLTNAFTEERYVGCKGVDDHPGVMLCGTYVVPDPDGLIEQARTSPDNTEEMQAGVDCRVWSMKLLRFILGPVHSCSTAIG